MLDDILVREQWGIASDADIELPRKLIVQGLALIIAQLIVSTIVEEAVASNALVSMEGW